MALKVYKTAKFTSETGVGFRKGSEMASASILVKRKPKGVILTSQQGRRSVVAESWCEEVVERPWKAEHQSFTRSQQSVRLRKSLSA